MNECNFIKKNYPRINMSKQQVRIFLRKYKKRVLRIYKNEHLMGIAFYFMLTDDTLNKVRHKEIDIKSPDVINRCFKEDGDNIHFFSVIADGYKTIRKGFKKVSKNNVKTISWFSPDMKQFFIRRTLCHQS